MERPSKNRVSSLTALLTALALNLGPALAAPLPADAGNAAITDTSLSKESLQARGAGLDNYIYEASVAKDSLPEAKTNESRQTWLLGFVAGAATLVGLVVALVFF